MASRSLGTLTLDLVAKIGGFTEPLEKAQRTTKKQMRQMERDAQDAAAGIAKVTAATAAAAASVIAFTNYQAQNAKQLKNQAAIANTSAEEFQKLAYASTSVSVEQEKLSDILKDVSDRVGDFMATGGGPMRDFFEQVAPKIGVTAKQFQNLSGPQALQLYYDSLEKANLSQADMTFYLEAMASDTTALIPLLRDGGRGFAEMAAEAEALGIVLSEQQIGSLNDLANQYDRITGIMSAAGSVAAAELAPAMSDLADELVSVAIAFQDGEYDEQIELLTKIGTVAGTAAGAYVAYRGAVAAATIAQWAFNAAATANPLGVFITVAGAAAGALIAFSDELGATSDEAYQSSLDIDGLTDAFEGLTEAQQENRRAAIVGDLVEMRLEAAKLGAELGEVSELVRNSGQLTEHGGAMPIASPEDIERGRELRGELDKLIVEIDASSDLLAEYDAIMADVGTTTRETSTRTREQIEAAEELEKAYQSILDRIRPLQATQRKYAEEKATLVEYALKENLAATELQSLLRDLQKDYRNAGSVAEAYGHSGTDAFNNVGSAAQDLGMTFESAFENAIVEGEKFRDVLDGVLKDILRIAVRKSVSEPVGNAIAGFDWGALFGSGGGSAISGGFTSQIDTGATFSGADGGYTGDGGKYDVAGIVHRGEYVVQKSVVEKPGVLPFLENLNEKGYANGGYVGGGSSGNSTSMGSVDVHIHNEGEPMKVQRTEQRQGPNMQKQIHIWVKQSVTGMMRSGEMDRIMGDNYGMSRRPR